MAEKPESDEFEDDDESAVAAAARRTEIRFDGERVFANGAEVTGEIRTTSVTQESRFIAANNAVRAHLVDLQRKLAAGRNIVTEGRDQGTVAFPHAECKLFMTADPRQRALRRQNDLKARGEHVSVEEILEQQASRDKRDEMREIGALKSADDAILIDTSHLTPTQMIDAMEQCVREKLAL